MTDEQLSPGDLTRRALAAFPERYDSSRAEFKDYLDTLDGASLNAARYLQVQLGINHSVIPKLLHLIDRERCELVLDVQVAELLERLEQEES